MTDFTGEDFYGVVSRTDELIAARPHATGSGFAAGNRVQSRQSGGYRSPFRGRGMEFDEVRVYQPGDDIRTIDWRVTARTGRTHTKLFQEERERPVLILLDARNSMRFGTRDCFKSVLAARAAAVLAWIAADAGDRVGGVLVSPSRIDVHRPERSRDRILHFIKGMAGATQEGFGREPPASEPGSEPSLADALARMRRTVRPGTAVFLVSDFNDAGEAAVRELKRLSCQVHVTNLFVYDGLEAQTPARGSYKFSDGRDVAVLDGRSPAAREAYAQRFAARRETIETLSRQQGMAYVALQTGQDPTGLLHPALLRQAWAAARGATG